jgi:predicted signal transduction protein with EAL and GGDEF domain
MPRPRSRPSRIRAGLEGPVKIGDRSVPVTFSIGVAASGGERKAGDLLADADAAMYRAKELGRDRVEIFDTELQRHALVRLDTEVALRGAVEHHELRLQYQPIVDLATGKVCGVEALVRWQRPGAGGVIQPSAFIGVAEDIGMIGAIGDWVLQTATAEVGGWVARGLVGPEFVLSVNVSSRQLANPEFPQQVSAAVAGWARPADRLWLEITETAVMTDSEVSETGLAELHELGVRLALDELRRGLLLAREARADAADLDPQARPLLRPWHGRSPRSRDRRGGGRAGGGAGDRVGRRGRRVGRQALAVTGVGFRYAQGFYFGAPADPDEAVRRLGGGRFSTRRTHTVRN